MTTLIADPCVAAIPVFDNGEPLIDVTTRDIGYDGTTPAGRLARRGVVDRLRLAQGFLPDGVRIVVVEGARHPEVQHQIFLDYTAHLRMSFPELDEGEIRRLASRYVAPLSVAPHVAGAAVDLTLCEASGDRLWMGTAVDATPEESDGACMFDAANIDAEARANRELLARALGGVGLVNYPTEWWHWSYGDRYWAHVTGAPYAVYGATGLGR
jgi:zinc D-Ala-D-Ala dipeptidase